MESHGFPRFPKVAWELCALRGRGHGVPEEREARQLLLRRSARPAETAISPDACVVVNAVQSSSDLGSTASDPVT